jgi:hypothetical protein
MTNQTTPTGSVRSQHGALWSFLMRRVINPVMRWLLTSRFHARLGSEMMTVLSFRGRRSGLSYTFPIGYMQEGNTLICYSPFGWWRNLRGGAPVEVVLRGRTVNGTADLCTDTDEIASGLDRYLRHNPGDARFFYVSLDDDRQPDPEDIARAAQHNVQIRINLD